MMRPFMALAAIFLLAFPATQALAGSGTKFGAAPAAQSVQNYQLDGTQRLLIEYALSDIGLNPGTLDGQLDGNTAQAIAQLQRNSGLAPTGQLDTLVACFLLQVGTSRHGSASKLPSWCQQ